MATDRETAAISSGGEQPTAGGDLDGSAAPTGRGPARSLTGLLYCDDCGRRFFNKGWHAEACGSPNYHEPETSAEKNRGAYL